MNAMEMMEKLMRHCVVRGNIGMQMQLGIPYLEQKNGKLCVTCLPHREDFRNGAMEFFEPQYKVTWVYPFDRIVYFENGLYNEGAEAPKVVHTMSMDRYAERGKYLMKDLYEQCSDVLAVYERDKKVSAVTLRKYQRAYFETVQAMGLTGVYGAENV